MDKFVMAAVVGGVGGVLLGAVQWTGTREALEKQSAAALSAIPPIEAHWARLTNVGCTGADQIKARALRDATRDFAISVSLQQATVRQLRLQASELELRLFSREFEEAEELFTEAQSLADESSAKADSVLAGNGRISDAWLAQLQKRLLRWHSKIQGLAARLP